MVNFAPKINPPKVDNEENDPMDLFSTNSSSRRLPIIYVIDDDDDGIGVSAMNNHHGKNHFFVIFKLYFSIIKININTNIVSIFNNEDNDIKLYNIFLPEHKTYIPSSKAKDAKNGKKKKKSTKKKHSHIPSMLPMILSKASS